MKLIYSKGRIANSRKSTPRKAFLNMKKRKNV